MRSSYFKPTFFLTLAWKQVLVDQKNAEGFPKNEMAKNLQSTGNIINLTSHAFSMATIQIYRMYQFTNSKS